MPSSTDLGLDPDAKTRTDVQPQGGALDVERARAILAECRDVERILEIRDAAKLAAEYHRLRGAGIASINDALELVLRAQRRFGAFLEEAVPAKGGRPKTDPQGAGFLSLKELGVSRKEASRCRKLAAIPEEIFEEHINTTRAKGEKLTTSGTIAATSEAKEYDGDSWGTPPEYIEAAREVLGGIDLDPASNERAQTIVLAETYLTKEEDGLSQPWHGRTWLNPPYSYPLVEQFVLKLIDEYEQGDVTAAICLVNNATDTGWCQELIGCAERVCFPKRRIPFLGPDNKPVRGTRQGQVVAYFGPDPEKFQRVYSQFGIVLKTV